MPNSRESAVQAAMLAFVNASVTRNGNPARANLDSWPPEMRASLALDIDAAIDAFTRSTGEGWFIPADCVSEVAAASLDRLIAHAKHGGSADLIFRVDAVETRWQADWIKYARRIPAAPHPPAQQESQE